MIVNWTYHYVKHLAPPGFRNSECRVEACEFHCHSSRAFGVDAVEKSSENGSREKHSLNMDLYVNGNVSNCFTSRTCTHISCSLSSFATTCHEQWKTFLKSFADVCQHLSWLAHWRWYSFPEARKWFCSTFTHNGSFDNHPWGSLVLCLLPIVTQL